MSIRCDASGDRAAYAGALSGAGSVGFWWRASALDQQYDAIFWTGDATAGGNAYDNSVMIVLGNPANCMEVWARNSTAARVGPTASFATNTWYFIFLNYNTGNGGALEIFVNGISAGTGTAGSAGAFQTERTEFGNDANSDNSPNSRIMGAKMWGRNLSQAQILNEMWSILPVDADSIYAVWPMLDDSQGLIDFSGNGRNLVESGTLTVEANDNGVIWTNLRPRGGWRRAAAGAGITGNTAVTDEADQLSGAGTLAVSGSAALSDSFELLSGSMTIAVAGSASVTDAPDQAAAVAANAVAASTVAQDQPDQVASTGGAPAANADTAVTDQPDQVGSAAALAVAGSTAVTDQKDELASSAALTIGGAASLQDQGDTLASALTSSIAAVGSILDLPDASAGGVTLAVAMSTSVTDAADLVEALAGAVAAVGEAAMRDQSEQLASAGVLIHGYVGTMQDQVDLLTASAGSSSGAVSVMLDLGDGVLGAVVTTHQGVAIMTDEQMLTTANAALAVVANFTGIDRGDILNAGSVMVVIETSGGLVAQLVLPERTFKFQLEARTFPLSSARLQ